MAWMCSAATSYTVNVSIILHKIVRCMHCDNENKDKLRADVSFMKFFAMKFFASISSTECQNTA